jgi:hypothetical protein
VFAVTINAMLSEILLETRANRRMLERILQLRQEHRGEQLETEVEVGFRQLEEYLRTAKPDDRGCGVEAFED